MSLYHNEPSVQLYLGDALTELQKLESNSVHSVVTSPPFYRLRNYQTQPVNWGDWEGELGAEPTPELYTKHIVTIFNELNRVLREDGTLWLNLGDTSNGSGGACGDYNPGGKRAGQVKYPGTNIPTLKPKDLIGIPWMVAFALQKAGWWLRSDIIWNKPNPGLDSAKDRPIRAHEYLFLLSKNKTYFYDNKAIDESVRDVWTISTQKGVEHTATFPVDLAKRCIQLSTSEFGVCEKCGAPYSRKLKDKEVVGWIPSCQCKYSIIPATVLDPFAGSGTVGVVSKELGRKSILIEIKQEYCDTAIKRLGV